MAAFMRSATRIEVYYRLNHEWVQGFQVGSDTQIVKCNDCEINFPTALTTGQLNNFRDYISLVVLFCNLFFGKSLGEQLEVFSVGKKSEINFH